MALRLWRFLHHVQHELNRALGGPVGKKTRLRVHVYRFGSADLAPDQPPAGIACDCSRSIHAFDGLYDRTLRSGDVADHGQY